MAFKYLLLYIDAHTFFSCVQYYSHFTVGNLLHPIDVQIDHVCPEVFNCIDLWPNKDVMWLIKSPIRYYTQSSKIRKKVQFCKVAASKGWKQRLKKEKIFPERPKQQAPLRIAIFLHF